MRFGFLKKFTAMLMCIAVILSMLIFTVSCGDNVPPNNNQAPGGNEDIPGGSTGDDTEGSPDADVGGVTVVDVLKNGATDYLLAFSNEGVEHEAYALLFSGYAEIDFDYVGFEPYLHTDKTEEKEILIGATNREISKELVKAVNAADKSGNDFVWGYGYNDGKLAFYANSDKALEYGWDEFCSAVFHSDGIYFDSDLWVIGRKSYSEYLFDNKLLFEGMTVSFFGDSITSFAGYSTPGNALYYGTAHAPYLPDVNDTYWMKLVKNYKMTLGVNDGWSGSRIGWDRIQDDGNASGAMIGEGKYMASQKRIDTLDDNGTPDFIVVYAGTNDIRREPLGNIDEVDWQTVLDYENTTPSERAEWRVDDFAHSTASMLAGLKMTYPDAHILVLIPMWVEVNPNKPYTATEEIVKTRVQEFGDLYIEVCRKFGIDYIDLRELCSFEDRESSGIFGDAPTYLHPSRKGMQMIFESMRIYYDGLMKNYIEE